MASKQVRIFLYDNDPIVLRTLALDPSKTLTEVGFIPGDQYGCKLYGGKSKDGSIRIFAEHSRVYGCKAKPQAFRAEILMSRRTHRRIANDHLEALKNTFPDSLYVDKDSEARYREYLKAQALEEEI